MANSTADSMGDSTAKSAVNSIDNLMGNSMRSSTENGYINSTEPNSNGHIHNGIDQKYKNRLTRNETPHPPFHMVISTYIGLIILLAFGYLRDFLRYFGIEKDPKEGEMNRDGYVPLFNNFGSFYVRNIGRRIKDMWYHPIGSVPGAITDVLERTSKRYPFNTEYICTGKRIKAINLGSYNYLGFAQNQGPIPDNVEAVINNYAIGVGSNRHEFGTTPVHQELEKLMTHFLGVEDSIVVGMGFATNSTNIPALLGKGCLVISDQLNHASLILGCKLSGANTMIFKHNDMHDLEMKIRRAIVDGQPRKNRPWKKIIVMVEGVYSMEGTIVNLPEIIRLKNKYKFYIYLDEAHSIGALGPRGRGVIDYYGSDPRDVDILMGTFTKSFGAAGGYIAGRKDLIDYLRVHSHSFMYATSLAPCIAQQIISTTKIIMDIDGSGEGPRRIKQLAWNAKYFRRKLIEMGFIVFGNDDSPVVPMMVYNWAKIRHYVFECLHNGIATIGAVFPITNLVESRVRFCMSASHTQEMLDYVLDKTDKIGDKLWMKYNYNEEQRQSQVPKQTVN